jgi:hypothetical protein
MMPQHAALPSLRMPQLKKRPELTVSPVAMTGERWRGSGAGARSGGAARSGDGFIAVLGAGKQPANEAITANESKDLTGVKLQVRVHNMAGDYLLAVGGSLEKRIDIAPNDNRIPPSRAEHCGHEGAAELMSDG